MKIINQTGYQKGIESEPVKLSAEVTTDRATLEALALAGNAEALAALAANIQEE